MLEISKRCTMRDKEGLVLLTPVIDHEASLRTCVASSKVEY